MAERLSCRPAEVRELIGIGRTKLRELLATGEIESFSVGRARLVSRATLERWVSQSTQAPITTEAKPGRPRDATEGLAAKISSRREQRAPGTKSVNGSAITTSQAPEG